jgi:hypothetical protein
LNGFVVVYTSVAAVAGVDYDKDYVDVDGGDVAVVVGGGGGG